MHDNLIDKVSFLLQELILPFQLYKFIKKN